MWATWSARMRPLCSQLSRHQVPLDVDFNISEAYLLELTKSGRPESRRGAAFQLLLADNSVYDQEGRFSCS